MLDMNLFRNEPDTIRKDHDKRGISHEKIDKVIELDQLWINLQHDTNQLRAQKNTAARVLERQKKLAMSKKHNVFWNRLQNSVAKLQKWKRKPMRQFLKETDCG